MLTPHRRHLKNCEFAPKGWNYTLCACPVWCDGMLHNRRITRSLQTTDWDRALRRMQMIEAGGEPSPEISATAAAPALGKTAEAFLADCRTRNLRESTLASYRRTMAHVTKALGAARPLAAIDVPTLASYRDGRQLQPRTARKEIEHLRSFFTWCVDRGWVAKNPARRIKVPLADDVATMPFSADEIASLIAACDRISSDNPAVVSFIRHRARALVYALLYSGLRISDVVKLRRAELDPATRHLTLRVMKTGVRLKVLLHPDAADALASLPAQNPEYFFWTGVGRPTHCANSMRVTLRRLGTLAGVANVHPHRFRDTFAVELLANNVDIRKVQLLLGHQSLGTTERHYAHFVSAHQLGLDSAAATLDFRPKPARPVLLHAPKRRRRS